MQKRLTFSLNPDVVALLKKTSEQTLIPQSRIVEEAIKDKCKALLEK